ncbi:MAG: threonine/serine dehydratase [candidate division Zixibacteria bacterium]|nr:threonine/serine dehydratase [candidate division Zixibacteria bacterium]
MRHPNLIDLLKARQVIAKYLAPTPQYRSPGLSERLGMDLYVKYENMQPIRSFKIRGALYSLSLLDAHQRAVGVVTASTGNHGQGIAYAATAMGIAARVIVPHGTPAVKRDAIRHFGVEPIFYGQTIADGFSYAKQMAAERGIIYIEDGEDFGLMAGAGTIALEMLEALPDADTLIIPVGGGNLIAGMGIAAKTINPTLRIVGVQAEKAPSVYLSLREGRVTTTETCDTFAGGLATTYPGGLAFEALKSRVDEIHLVSEEEMRQAIPTILEHTGYVAEGATAAVFALCIREAHRWAGQRVVALFSGGNLGMEELKKVL